MMAWIRSTLRSARGAVLALGVTLMAAACNFDELLEVELPDQIPTDGLAEPQNAKLLTDGAVADFECAYGAYVALTSVMAGEMMDATPTAARWPYDRRSVNPNDGLYSTSDCEALGIYTPLSRARWSADNILQHLQEWTDEQVPDRQRLIATAAAYAGYSRVLLAEGFCTVAGINNGPELTPEQVLQNAIERFNTAIEAAQGLGDGDPLLNFAYMGRARAYLGLGNGAAAVADAQRIPPGFVYGMSADTAPGRRVNRVFAQSGTNTLGGGNALTVAPAYRALQHMGVADPRVPVIDAGFEDEGVAIFWQAKYPTRNTPIPIASYDEAQLIIAEVEGGATAEAIINDFHTAAGLPAFDATGLSDAEILAHVIEERRSELWLEGHRFHDIRRHELPLDPEPGTPHRRGGFYGDDRCFPLPSVEIRNNPNI
ncbi:MAG TPA: RagB/SusD family nutrient uptake outer membrane protein [Longimicrobiales bacterium]